MAPATNGLQTQLQRSQRQATAAGDRICTIRSLVNEFMKLSHTCRAIALAVLLSLFATCAFAAEVVEVIVARVNNQIITRSELQNSRQQMLNEFRQQNIAASDPRVTESDRNLLRDLIDQQLLVQKGQDLGITADTELVKRLDELRKQMNLDSMEAMEKAATEQGINFDDYKQHVRNQIITQQVIQREIGGKLEVTQQEVQKYYDSHKPDLAQPEQVRLSEVLITPASNDPAAQAVAQQKAAQALAEIKSGKSFEDVAKQFSTGPTASAGGDLGYFARGSLARELEEKTFAMKVGDVSDIILTRQGLVILKVTEHTEAGSVPLSPQLENQIRETLYQERMQPALREYLTTLREQAFVDVRPGYVDTGASPNQTKPVEMAQDSAASQAPADKKKKKKLGVF